MDAILRIRDDNCDILFISLFSRVRYHSTESITNRNGILCKFDWKLISVT